MSSIGPHKKDFTVGWICALPDEMAPACAMLDEEFDMLESQHPADSNSYRLGRIGDHNIVIACLPEYGTNPAATVANNMLRTFDSIKVGLMVGIGAGIPSEDDDIRLGDIVVSSPDSIHGGVVQFDRGKTKDGEFERTGTLNKPPTLLRTALANMRAHHLRKGDRVAQFVQDALKENPPLRKNKYVYQGSDNDPMDRDTRNDQDPVIHYGTIASSNQVIKDEHERDRLRRELGAKCIEMEAAGLMDNFPCLVIRGICDYADSMKNKRWQHYAAITAAAYAKEFLGFVRRQSLEQVPDVLKVLNSLANQMTDLHLTSQYINTEVQELGESQRFAEATRWLSPADASENYRKALEKRHPDTGSWFLEGKEFSLWNAGTNPHLWLYGIPGCGKTVLSSAVINNLRERNLTVLYFYFDFRSAEKQTADDMVRSLLAQLYPSQEACRPPLDTLRRAGSRPGTESLFRTLIEMLKTITNVHIVLDALDESKERIDLLEHIERYLGAGPNIRLLITSRREQDIESSLAWISEGGRVPLQVNLVDDDIQLYIRDKIREDKEFQRWQEREDILIEIETTISHKAGGMFRWAALQLVELSTRLSEKMLIQALETLPKDLNETYSRILKNIPSEYQECTITLLQLLVYSDSPLQIEEAVDAIAVDCRQTPPFHPKYRMPQPNEILRLCSSLVVITDFWGAQELQLAHFSVKEYLVSDSVEKSYRPHLCEIKARASIVKLCLAYLSTTPLDVENYAGEQSFRLWSYSSWEWTGHARVAEKTYDSTCQIVRKLFLEMGEAFKNWVRLRYLGGGIGEHWQLYIAADVGLMSAVTVLLANGVDVNATVTDAEYSNALAAAVAMGHEDVVETLLANGANVNTSPRAYSQESMLELAAKRGSTKLMHILLDNGADANFQGRFGLMMHSAIDKQHEQIVKILLDRGPVECLPGYPNHERDWIRLHQAVHEGDVDRVQLLVDCGADVNFQSEMNTTALCIAVGRRDRAVLQTLLDNGADVNRQCGWYSGSALHEAVDLRGAGGQGYVDTVRILLDHGADVNYQCKCYGTALYAAAEAGHVDMVRLLLDHGADVDLQGGIYCASGPALRAASRIFFGHSSWLQYRMAQPDRARQAEIMRMLLTHGANPRGFWDPDDTNFDFVVDDTRRSRRCTWSPSMETGLENSWAPTWKRSASEFSYAVEGSVEGSNKGPDDGSSEKASENASEGPRRRRYHRGYRRRSI